MQDKVVNPKQFAITSNYDWCTRAFRTTRKLLKLNIKLHDESQQPCKETIEQGDIFLFNHFARFETFIPQYLIHAETGHYCRSIASAEFFGDERFASFLRSIGVVPNSMPDLFPFLAREILHGRKLIIFPEGGMVKDKRVVNEKGQFGIFSRTALERRKHHRGAAVIALALDAFKTALLRDYSTGNYKKIERWAEQLGFVDTESLMIKALKPTCIVPSQITFYPIRVNDNILYQAARLLNKGINKRFAEELIIEGNLLFKQTDMDIRFAKPMVIGRYWKWWEKFLLPNVVHSFESLQELFKLTPHSGHFGGRIHSIGMKIKSNRVRDDYMKAMYNAVTINLSHIASYILLQCYQQDIKSIEADRFHKTLFVCIKKIQQCDVNLHRSLRNPAEYKTLIDGGSSRLGQFLETIQNMKLIKVERHHYVLLDKLINEFNFDEIRTENLVSVYANEITPLKNVTQLIKSVFRDIDRINDIELARYRLDDQYLTYQWDREKYIRPRYAEINNQQTFTQDGNWFYLEGKSPKSPKSPGILLIHGFMATPAEMKPFGESLNQLGFHVIGVRLKGHGTSPWDLRDTNWQDWAASVHTGFEILKAFCSQIHIIGFSTGGLLSLLQAANHPHPQLASAFSVSAPVDFKNRNMRFVPLLHRANRMVSWVSSEGLIPFRPNDTEHPDINYAHIPIRALYQLQKMIQHFFAHAAIINCPVYLFQSDQDPVVVTESVNHLHDHIDSKNKHIEIIASNHHGILYDDIDNTQQKILDIVLALTNHNKKNKR
jgi:esterase/lipase